MWIFPAVVFTCSEGKLAQLPFPLLTTHRSRPAVEHKAQADRRRRHRGKMAVGQIYWMFLCNRYSLGRSHLCVFIPQKETEGCAQRVEDVGASRHLPAAHLQPASGYAAVRGTSVGCPESSEALSEPIRGHWAPHWVEIPELKYPWYY